MQLLHSIAFYFHIVIGSMALLLFWVPMMTRKGSLDHIKFGRHFAYAMYGLAFSGFLMTGLALSMPMAVKGHLLTNAMNEAEFIASVRRSQYFLLFLSLLVYVSIHQGMAVLKVKQHNHKLRTLPHILPIVLLLCLGLGLVYLGWARGFILHIIFGCLGVFISAGMLKYCFAQKLQPGQWVREHLGGMIGAGIGAYTAFLAFGARELLSGIGYWQLAFWVGPGVIGSIAITYYSRQHRQKM